MAAMLSVRRRIQCYLPNPSFISGVRSVYKLGLNTGDLNGGKKWPMRRDISTKEENEGENIIMVTLKREGQALSQLHEKDLIAYFSSYGKIQHVNWIRDRATNDVKGYGFVTFYHTDSLMEAVKTKRHVLGGRQVDVFPASEREKSFAPHKKRIVVKRQRGTWEREMDLESLQDYFSKFGEIENVDAKNLQTDGFVHVTFKNIGSIESVLFDKQHNIDGEIVLVFKGHYSGQQWKQLRFEKEISKLKFLNNWTDDKKGSRIIVQIPKRFKDCISERHLKEYFSSYGEIQKAFVLRNDATLESKGFGIVSFKDSHVAEEILADENHKIGSADVYVKRTVFIDE